MATANKDFSQTAQNLGEHTKDAAKNMGQQASDTAQDLASRARDMAQNVGSQAKDMASNVAHKAGDAASFVGQQAKDMPGNVGAGIKNLAGTIRENVPHEGFLGTAGSSVADTLETGGRYLQEHGFGDMGEDLTNLIRRNPVPALALGVGLGFLLGRLMSSSRS